MCRRRRTFVLAMALAGVVGSGCGVEEIDVGTQGIAARGKVWQVTEIQLRAQRRYANPYKEVEITAVFTGPDKTTKRVRGFWDDGDIFRVRFTPPRAGTWRYSITSNQANDGGLRQSGELRVAGGSGDGFLRVDASTKRSLVFDSGARHLTFANTYYGIVDNVLKGGGWKAAIRQSKRYGIDRVRFLLHPWGKPAAYGRSIPYASDGDHDRLNIGHWKAVDKVVQHLAQQKMTADIIFFPDSNLAFGSRAQDERFVRYVIARYAAYPNVVWCLANEWSYSPKNATYWQRLGKIVSREDPWATSANGNRRLLSIHNRTDWNFQFHGARWPSHAIVQVGQRNGGPRLTQADAWGNRSITVNAGRGRPVVNDEYGYIGESAKAMPTFSRERHRNAIWGVLVAGGAGAAVGDARAVRGWPNYRTSDWKGAAEYSDIKHLLAFFRGGVPFWKMQAANALVKSGDRVYVLADRERANLVIYSARGGALRIALPGGSRYNARRYDPRTGRFSSLPEVRGSSSTNLTTPRGDHVIHLFR